MKKLSLVHVEEIDWRAIAIITIACPNIMKLGIQNCEFMDEDDAQGEERLANDVVVPFRNADRILRMDKWREAQKQVTPLLDLEILKISSMCSERTLTFLLSQCINVKEIYMGMTTCISDQVWSDVFTKNSLSHLECLKIQKCSKVTMYGIELLLANCDQLTSLMNLTYFEGIKEEELQQFEQKIKAQNLNLQLEEQNTDIYDVSDSNFMNYKLKDKYPAFDNSNEWETGWSSNS